VQPGAPQSPPAVTEVASGNAGRPGIRRRDVHSRDSMSPCADSIASSSVVARPGVRIDDARRRRAAMDRWRACQQTSAGTSVGLRSVVVIVFSQPSS
jgi:hypothetical protein